LDLFCNDNITHDALDILKGIHTLYLGWY